MSETKTGLIGEFIAAAAILGMPGGWRVSMAQQDKVDLVAWDQNGSFVRVQAKAANLLCDKDGRGAPRHHFQLGHGSKTKYLPNKEDYDVLCLFSPNCRRCLFMPITAVRQYSMRLPASKFSAEREADSWDKTIKVIMEMRR